MDDLTATYLGSQLDPDELAELTKQREAQATAERRRKWEAAQRGEIIDRTQARIAFEPPRPRTDLQEAGKRIRGTRPYVDGPSIAAELDAAPQRAPRCADRRPVSLNPMQPINPNPLKIGPRPRIKVSPTR